jgi:hypothetical protein
MAKRLRVVRRKAQKKEVVHGPMDLETDPCDPESGIASHWYEMVVVMEVEMTHTKDGVKPVWRRRTR